MVMKVGDRLICKRNYSIYHTIGKTYEIIGIKKHVVDIFDDFSHCTEYMHNDKMKAKRRVWDYFYTEKELRKLKLEEINERK